MALSAAKIAFIMYPVTDMPRATAFYEGVLGLRRDGLALDYWVEYDLDGTTFGIGNFEQLGKPGTAGALALEVPNVAEVRAVLAKHEIESSEPFETPICLISQFHDPDGNTVSLHQRRAP